MRQKAGMTAGVTIHYVYRDALAQKMEENEMDKNFFTVPGVTRL